MQFSFVMLFSLDTLRDQIRPCHEGGQGYSSVIICTYFQNLDFQLLHTKFKAIGRVVLEKTNFNVFTIYGHDGNYGHVTWPKYINPL